MIRDAGGESAYGYIADVAQKMLDADLLGLLSLDGGRGVYEGFGGGSAVLFEKYYD